MSIKPNDLVRIKLGRYKDKIVKVESIGALTGRVYVFLNDEDICSFESRELEVMYEV